jgi:hypothetical protein
MAPFTHITWSRPSRTGSLETEPRQHAVPAALAAQTEQRRLRAAPARHEQARASRAPQLRELARRVAQAVPALCAHQQSE